MRVQLIYTTNEIAHIFQIKYETVIKWIQRGKLQADSVYLRNRKDYRVHHDIILRYLRSGAALSSQMRTCYEFQSVTRSIRNELLLKYIITERLYQMLHTSRGTLQYCMRVYGFPKRAICITGLHAVHAFDRRAVITWLNAHPGYWTPVAQRELLH